MGSLEHDTVDTERYSNAKSVPIISTIESIAPTLFEFIIKID